jgi:hypothetical protein
VKILNIHIITVYDSLNYGSYFQALASMTELSKYGNVDFVNIKHQNILNQTLERIIKDSVRLRFNSAVLEKKKYHVFKKAHQIFKVVDKKNISQDDYLVFGSDEIWNISREKIRRSKEFFGVGFSNKNKIALAPSVNNTTFEQLYESSYIKDELMKFSHISARDRYTKKNIDRLAETNCSLVADPTMMFTKDFYKSYQKKIKNEKYIVLYTYGSMLNKKVIEKIRDFAESEKCRIISLGKWFGFCDECIAASPGEFLGYIDDAEYVFTDTFHGTVFSILYEKQFVSFSSGNVKVEETLNILNLKERICGSEQSIKEVIDKKIDYYEVSRNVREFGNKTRVFLNRALEISGEENNVNE